MIIVASRDIHFETGNFYVPAKPRNYCEITLVLYFMSSEG